ncbi:hypothetical protein TNCV_2509701 [Trichonephila clavipes]|nr:hypothetical protein TNCV_2509701 [Trichonephila clavipes]
MCTTHRPRRKPFRLMTTSRLNELNDCLWQEWADFSRVRAASNIFRVLWSTQRRRFLEATNLISEVQWLSGSVPRFHATGPGFKPRGGHGRLSFSSLQWIDKGEPSLLGN